MIKIILVSLAVFVIIITIFLILPVCGTKGYASVFDTQCSILFSGRNIFQESFQDIARRMTSPTCEQRDEMTCNKNPACKAEYSFGWNCDDKGSCVRDSVIKYKGCFTKF